MHVVRRDFLRLGLASAMALPLSAAPRLVQAADAPTQTLSPDAALQKLMEGNARFAAGTMTSPNQSLARRAALVSGQAPFATILGCADSRVPPELVFDTGLGDLFVVRVAGNAPSPELLASIDYSHLVLGSPLVMVLGHTSCGAIGAALDHLVTGKPLPTDHLQTLVEDLAYGVSSVLSSHGDQKANATKLNVQLGVEEVATSNPAIEAAIAGGTLKIVGGIYDLASGVVSAVPPM
jgi:carbonic anhydrase